MNSVGTPLSPAERADLLDLISNYSHRWDGRDPDGWVALFTDDAVLQASFRGTLAWKYGSNSERLAFVHSFYDGAGAAGLLQTRHFQTNTVLRPQADGSVDADTMFAVTFQYEGEPAPRLGNTGIYRDRLVKSGSGWRFARREILVDQDAPKME